MNLSWVPHVFALELKKLFSYRVAFWVQFLLGTGVEITVAYLVWKAVYTAAGVNEMEGFTFHGLVLYSLLAAFSVKVTRGAERGYLAQDIYDGGLTKYLLYPLPFFPYKYVTHMAQQFMAIFQLGIGLTFFWLLIGDKGGQPLTFGSVAAGVATCFIAGYLHFVMASCLELVAFWQDVIWNIMVMLRFCVSLLGGAMIPLAFFPEWGQRIVHLTPFPALVSFPIRTFLGHVGMAEWIANVGILVIWSLLFTLVLNWIWIRGSKQYSGVGI
jgi:ABC-2 type transport system permease protein